MINISSKLLFSILRNFDLDTMRGSNEMVIIKMNICWPLYRDINLLKLSIDYLNLKHYKRVV